MSLSQANVDAVSAGGTPETASPGASEASSQPLPVTASPPARETAPQTPPRPQELSRILGLSVSVAVTLAERDMTVDSILEMTAGTIIEFDVPFDAELTLQIGNRTIGLGQAVKIVFIYGTPATEIYTVPERIDALSTS